MAEYNDYFTKAANSLLGAESELAHSRYDNSVNRAYYASFQAAIAALIAADVLVQAEGGGIISHRAVHRQFAGILVQHRRLYPSRSRNVLQDLLRGRIVADYHSNFVSSTRATRVLHQSQIFVSEIQTRLKMLPGETI